MSAAGSPQGLGQGVALVFVLSRRARRSKPRVPEWACTTRPPRDVARSSLRRQREPLDFYNSADAVEVVDDPLGDPADAIFGLGVRSFDRASEKRDDDWA